VTESDIALNYATAFIETLKSAEDIQKAGDDLDTFASVLRDLRALPRVLEHPGLSLERRHEILDEVLKKLAPHPMSKKFLRLVVDKGRLSAMSEIARTFSQLRDQKLGTAQAEVISAKPIPKSHHAEWEQAVAEKAGREVRLKFSTDPDLLGGAVVRIGDVVYDGSIRKQIARIRRALLQ
jgi:F-type H+-transporting ATPase subunit delta